MRETKQNIMVERVPGKEVLGHALGGVGQNLIYALWSSYITIFYTDIFGLPAAFMGMLFLVARIWDGVNDPMMGVFADRTKSKYGRFRVWLLRMPIFVAVCLILNFTVPSFGGTPKLVYAAITYVLMGMAFTSLDGSSHSGYSDLITISAQRRAVGRYQRCLSLYYLLTARYCHGDRNHPYVLL